jgi:hypothetical protein
MANPNIVNVVNILGKTAVALVTTTPTDLVSNNAGSNTILKVNVLSIANVSGVLLNTRLCIMFLFRQQHLLL